MNKLGISQNYYKWYPFTLLQNTSWGWSEHCWMTWCRVGTHIEWESWAGGSWKLQHWQGVAYPSTIIYYLYCGEDIGTWQTLGLVSLMYIGLVSVTSLTWLIRLLPLQVSSQLAGRPRPQSPRSSSWWTSCPRSCWGRHPWRSSGWCYPHRATRLIFNVRTRFDAVLRPKQRREYNLLF